MSVSGPLLITSRSAVARQVTSLAGEVVVTLAAPAAVSRAQWSSASAVIVDAAALPGLRTRTLPAVPHVWVVTDTPPTPQVFVDAVALRVERVVELPAGGVWLAEAIRAVARRASVIAVVGIGRCVGQVATTVLLALAFDALRRDESVAVLGWRGGQTLARYLDAVSTDTPTPDPTRAGRLTVLIRGDRPAQPAHTPRLITELTSGHHLVLLDTPPPDNRDRHPALDHADLVLAVATPDQRDHPHLAGLTAPDSATADRVRVAIVTSDPTQAGDRGHPLPRPTTPMAHWITDPDFGRHCAAVADPTRA